MNLLPGGTHGQREEPGNQKSSLLSIVSIKLINKTESFKYRSEEATKAPDRNCIKRTENYIGSDSHSLRKDGRWGITASFARKIDPKR